MKDLKAVLEGILDIDFDSKYDIAKDEIEKWIAGNTPARGLSISDSPNEDGKYVANASHVYVKSTATTLTNDLFIWGKVDKNFECTHCDKLVSLHGAPEYVGGNFDCSYTNIKSLKGAPKKVGGSFDCAYTPLKSLKGAPEHVGGDFYCNDTKIISLDGSPKAIKGSFNCDNTPLSSLKGMPKEIGGNFNCMETNITKDEVEKVKFRIRGLIYVNNS